MEGGAAFGDSRFANVYVAIEDALRAYSKNGILVRGGPARGSAVKRLFRFWQIVRVGRNVVFAGFDSPRDRTHY